MEGKVEQGMPHSAKDAYLQGEGDAYFERNFLQQQDKEAAVGVKIFKDFISNQMGGYSLVIKNC